MIIIIKYIFFLVLLLAIQLFVFDNIYIFQDTRPVVFFYFILILPYIPAPSLMAIAFITGLLYDFFLETPGINAAAMVLLAYLKPPLLRYLTNEEEESDNIYAPHINYLGGRKFFTYISLTSLIFHLIVTFLSVFSFSEIINTIIRVGLGTVLSIAMIYILDIVFFYRKRESS